MNSLGPRIAFTAVLALAVALWGCGSTNSFTSTPTASGTTPSAGSTAGGSSAGSGGTGGSGSGGSSSGGSSGGSGSGSTAGFSDQLAPCGTKNGTTYQITGRIIDSTTGQPIAGKGLADINSTTGSNINALITGTTGGFASAQLVLSQNSFAIVFYGVSSSGVQYVPKILVPSPTCPITQGTELGTIALTPGAAATANVLVTGQTSTAQPAQISVEEQQFHTSFMGTNWTISEDPYLASFRINLQTGPICPANTSCIALQYGLSASPPVGAVYAGAGTQFQPAATSAVWTYSVGWNNALNSSVSNHCTPQFASSTPQMVTPGATLNFGTLAFTGC